MKRITEGQDNFFFEPENAGKYLEEVKKGTGARFRNFLSTLNTLDVRGRYLDVGCGPGILTQEVAVRRPDAEITGIDISPEMIKLADNELATELSGRIRFKTADACNTETMNDLGTFDLIFSTFTMHHWNEPALPLRNLFAILNPGGFLYIYDLKRVAWLYYLGSKGGFMQSIRASFTRKEIRMIMEQAGISDYSLKTLFPFFMQSLLVRK